MKSIVLLRHGESVWNKENRFTGWTDVDLTEKGVAEAYRAGNLLKEKGYVFNKAYTSYLKRAVKTLNCVLDRMDQDWIPVEKSWRLNEKHYGSLQGLNKSETAQKYGDEQVLIWRRSYDIGHVAPVGQDHVAGDDPQQQDAVQEKQYGSQRFRRNRICRGEPVPPLLERGYLPDAPDRRPDPCRRSRKQLAGNHQIFKKHLR